MTKAIDFKVTIHNDDKQYTLRLTGNERESLYAVVAAIATSHNMNVEEMANQIIEITSKQ